MLLEPIHIDKRHHDADGRAVAHPVRPHSQRIPSAVLYGDILLDTLQLVRNARNQFVPVFARKVGCNFGEWPADIGRREIQDALRCWSESPDPAIAVQDEKRNIGPGQETAQIVRKGRQLYISELEFLVQCCELLIRGLKLFLGACQLFIGAGQF